MHAVFGGQFRHRALALHGLQRHAGLEPRIMVPAFLHVLISSLLETSRRQIVASVTVRFSGSSITNRLRSRLDERPVAGQGVYVETDY